MAACSLGKWPRWRTARRNRALRLSMALVSGMKEAGVSWSQRLADGLETVDDFGRAATRPFLP